MSNPIKEPAANVYIALQDARETAEVLADIPYDDAEKVFGPILMQNHTELLMNLFYLVEQLYENGGLYQQSEN